MPQWNRIAPTQTNCSIQTTRNPTLTAQPRKLRARYGYAYIICSMALAGYYISILTPYATNDLWWPYFDTTGSIPFIADMVNNHIAVQFRGPLDFVNHIQHKDYTKPTTQIHFRFPLGRYAVYGNLSLESVVGAIRNIPISLNFAMGQPYCWVDFNRSFELAHTATRQKRCLKWTQNAAMYLEPLLRNVMPDDTSSIHDTVNARDIPWHDALNGTIYSPLNSMTGGSQWVDYIKAHTIVTKEEEVAYWLAAGTSHWQNQVKNDRQVTFTDTIEIWNPLGVAQTFTINYNVLESSHSMNQDPATSQRLYYTFADDLMICLDPQLELDCTVVRGNVKSLEAMDVSWDEIYYYQEPVGSNLIRSAIGPFGSIDALFMPVPTAFGQLYLVFNSLLSVSLSKDSTFLGAYSSMDESVTFDPIPSSWRNISSYGGNILCPNGPLVPYVQSSFHWGSDCSQQLPLSTTTTQRSMFFAMLAYRSMNNLSIQSICSHCLTTEASCKVKLTQATSLLQQWDLPFQSIVDEVMSLNISIFQMAEVNGSNQVLIEPIIHHTPWSFFGWNMMYQWLEGKREVYTFEGDRGAFTLISELQEFYDIDSKPLELTHVAGQYVTYTNMYISSLLIFVGLLTLCFGVLSKQTSIEGYNLFFFNRIAAAVWVGRPLLLVRGATALLLLSVSPISFQNHNGLAQYVNAPKSVVSIGLLAGEAVWFSYALQDFLLPFTSPYSSVSSPLCACILWINMVSLELARPYKITFFVERVCRAIQLGSSASCTCGKLEFGSYRRLLWLSGAHIGYNILIYAFVRRFWSYFSRFAPASMMEKVHIIIPATAEAFLVQNEKNGTLDYASYVMCGVIPLHKRLFDIKLWVFVATAPSEVNKHQRKTFAMPISPSIPVNTTFQKRKLQLLGFLGLLYMITSVGSSYYFIQKVENIMANDFWWPHFNSSGHQTFIANFFTLYLQVGSHFSELKLDLPTYGDTSNRYNSTPTSFYAPKLYPSAIQEEANTIVNVVTSLRGMDGCKIPWIFTSYCYVDFDQSWEMAPSISKQMRCLKDKHNGAIYLETFLRNAYWPSLHQCWGNALEIGVFSYLRQTQDGHTWLREALTNSNSILDEVNFWSSRGILVYTTQWQNFKDMRLTESISIQNAFGMSYPFSIKNYVGDTHINDQTSFKMYWGFANDLWSISTNSTSIGNMHLVRQSSNFAFTNYTMEDIYMENMTLSSPLSLGFSLVRENLGPFGTVTMKLIACPRPLKSFYKQLHETMYAIINFNSSVEQRYLNLTNPYGGLVPPVSYIPPAWDWDYNFRGGDLLCGATSSPLRIPGAYFSSTGTCMNHGWWYVAPPASTLKSILATGLNRSIDLRTICIHDSFDGYACMEKIQSGIDFLYDYLNSTAIKAFAKMGMQIALEIHSQLGLELVQFLNLDVNLSALQLSRVHLFNNDSTTFFAWQFIFEWVEGRREVVQFQGDLAAITTLSKYQWDPRNQFANPTEIPRNFALYIYRLAVYISSVLLVVAFVACIYIIVSRGYVEGLNMTEFNRVAGAIWVGRPLMLVRGCVALCLLSTASLDLSQTNQVIFQTTSTLNAPVFRFKRTVPDTLVTLLSASEVNWIVYLINDVFSIITQEYSYWSSTTSALVAWIIVAIWSLVVPVEHIASISRTCTVAEVGYDVSCRSGTLEIGRVSRLLGLIGVSFGASFMCYAIQRILWPSSTTSETHSKYLCSVARYNFALSEWECYGVQHLDRASALFNGMLTFKTHKKISVFDIKTWRYYTIPINPVGTRIVDERFRHSIPLAE